MRALLFLLYFKNSSQICSTPIKNLRFVPDIHRHEPIVKASFAYDRELIALGKSQKGARWSQSLQSWCFSKKKFN